MKSRLRSLLTPRRNGLDDQPRYIVENADDTFGLKVLVPGYDPVVDIVAVHGLNGHREKSWVDDESGVLWLRDLLPRQFPNARILTFGYDADTVNLSEVSHLTLNNHGTSLIVELLRLRRSLEIERRPIIFFAHSLGGIVVKHALVTCDSAKRGHNEEYRSIKLSTYGVVFFGTPQAGASNAEFQRVINNIGRIFLPGHSIILQLLRRDSEYLRYLSELYAPISSHFNTIVFYEEFNTPLFKGASTMIVPRVSAVDSEAANTVAIALHKHHIDLVKYSSVQDSAFQTVLTQIDVMMGSALQQVTKRWEQDMRMKNIDDQRLAKFSVKFDLPHRNLQFLGRTKELLWLSDIVRDIDTDQCKVVVLYGLGGMGKTDIVAHYAWQSHATYTPMLWIDAATVEALNHSFMKAIWNIIQHLAANYSPERPDYARIADDLGIAGLVDPLGQMVLNPGSDNQDRIMEALFNWLTMEGNDKWLLVFDNADDMNVIDRVKHFPQISSGTIIITSQKWESAHWGTGFQIEGMDQDDALSLLMTKTHLDWKWLSTAECKHALNIVKELGYVPLAIEHAGAYIWSQGLTLDEYMTEYKTNFQRASEHRPKGLDDYAAVYTTWHMNLEAIKANDLQAAQLLGLYSFFSNNVSDKILLYEQEKQISETNRTRQLKTSMDLLLSYSLVKRNNSQLRAWIHPLVHQWTRQHLTASKRLQQTQSALNVMARSIDCHSKDQAVEGKLAFANIILPDVIACAENAIEYLQNQPGINPVSRKSFMIVKDFLEAHGIYKHSFVLTTFLKSTQEKFLG